MNISFVLRKEELKILREIQGKIQGKTRRKVWVAKIIGFHEKFKFERKFVVAKVDGDVLRFSVNISDIYEINILERREYHQFIQDHKSQISFEKVEKILRDKGKVKPKEKYQLNKYRFIAND